VLTPDATATYRDIIETLMRGLAPLVRVNV
jgi:hypothetical protein